MPPARVASHVCGTWRGLVSHGKANESKPKDLGVMKPRQYKHDYRIPVLLKCYR